MNLYFSIVIPTYNRAHLIGRTLDSVAAQTCQDFEVIIVDDGSTDNTASVIQPWQSTRFRYYQKENAERASARNYGASLARGRYVYFLDSDDTLYPHHLATAYTTILAHSLPPMVVLGYDIRNEHGETRYVEQIHDLRKQILEGNPLSCHGVFLRKDVISQDRFCERRDLSGFEDWELWIRLIARHSVVVNPVITSSLTEHSERSVLTDSEEKIKKKVLAFQEEVVKDIVAKQMFGARLKRAVASASTYAALHLALIGAQRKLVFYYLWRGLLINPRTVFRRRFLVILRLLII